MKLLRSVLFLQLMITALTGQTIAQSILTITVDKENWGHVVYANNSGYCPVSMAIDLELDNANFSNRKDKFFVIPPQKKRVKLGTISGADRRREWNYKYQIRSCYGDIRLTSYDSLFEYQLPYPRDSAYAVIQGYGGSFSHQQFHALDFNMPENTPILASRGGIVIETRHEFTTACLEDSCKNRGNRIVIYHSDGTMASYVHLRYNGALVKEADSVTIGQVIGYSGNTGYSKGPHLHFDCFLPNPEIKRTYPTRFLLASGKPAEYLTTGFLYKREY